MHVFNIVRYLPWVRFLSHRTLVLFHLCCLFLARHARSVKEKTRKDIMAAAPEDPNRYKVGEADFIVSDHLIVSARGGERQEGQSAGRSGGSKPK